MPDTDIADQELLGNAEEKARRLGLNSFVVWNGNDAALYRLNATDVFELARRWPSSGLPDRLSVQRGRATWVTRLREIIDAVNDLLDSGEVAGAKPAHSLGPSVFVDLLAATQPAVADHLRSAYASNATFAAILDTWWADAKEEFPGASKWDAFARSNVLSWVTRFLFAHYLKSVHSVARDVEAIADGVDVVCATAIFEQITARCDFLNVFHPLPGQEHLGADAWPVLVGWNRYLTDCRLDTLPQSSLHVVLEQALAYGRKKLAGQFATPQRLADLLVGLTVENREKDVLDPCCGTGTVARAIYDLKRAVGLDVRQSLETVWASDKFSFPLQLCSIALLDPMAAGEIVQVFQRDAFELAAGLRLDFTDPSEGQVVVRDVKPVHAITTNLPFVRFEDAASANPLIQSARAGLVRMLGDAASLDGRSDLYAFLILHLRGLLEESGYIGAITSNSWLGTEWGATFRAALRRYFKIAKVVVSGAGRWFENADVVTTILVLQKRANDSPEDPGESVEFITTRSPCQSWDVAAVSDLVRSIRMPKPQSDTCTKRCYTLKQIDELESLGFGWASLFANLTWTGPLKDCVIPVRECFVVGRGERRGWDEMFYPRGAHGIEPEYLQPVLFTAASVPGMIARPDRVAFCCSEDLADLESQGKHGAAQWIRRFQSATNGNNRPLPEVLRRSGQKWYEMRPTTLADLVTTLNPDKRLCIHRLERRAFVNQRLIGFSSRTDVVDDVELCHALLNSAVGMLFLEAAGFGRGLGALDLTPTKISRSMQMLDPRLIDATRREEILSAFESLVARPVLPLLEELAAADRIAFDEVVFRAYGIQLLRPLVYETLRELFGIRQAARGLVVDDD